MPLLKKRKKELRELPIDALKDIQAVQEILRSLKGDVQPMLKELQKLEELEKERGVAAPGLLHINLETQAEVLDTLLRHYEFFQNDIDINGARLKEVARQLLLHAKNAGMHDLVKERRKKMEWKFDW